MLTDTNLRSSVDALWDKLWSGGLSNPLDAIEQLSFLLFLNHPSLMSQIATSSWRTRRGKSEKQNLPESARRCGALVH